MRQKKKQEAKTICSFFIDKSIFLETIERGHKIIFTSVNDNLKLINNGQNVRTGHSLINRIDTRNSAASDALTFGRHADRKCIFAGKILTTTRDSKARVDSVQTNTVQCNTHRCACVPGFGKEKSRSLWGPTSIPKNVRIKNCAPSAQN